MLVRRAGTNGMSTKCRDGLAKYVDRVLKEKHLTLRDVQVMSGWKITDAYVGSIIRGRANNPSVEKLQALARGLGVDENEIFRVARGMTGGGSVANREGNPWNSLMIVRMMEQVVSQPGVKEILEEIVELSEEDRAVVLRTARSFSKSPRKHHHRRQRG